jgi:hypothetical protein
MKLRSILIWVRGSLQLAAVCCAFFSAPTAHANLLFDGSFETSHYGIPEDRVFVGGGLDDYWSVDEGVISLVGGGWQASDGKASIELAGLGNTGEVSQSFAVIPYQTYLVTFDLSGNPDNSHGEPTLKQLEACQADLSTCHSDRDGATSKVAELEVTVLRSAQERECRGSDWVRLLGPARLTHRCHVIDVHTQANHFPLQPFFIDDLAMLFGVCATDDEVGQLCHIVRSAHYFQLLSFPKLFHHRV